MTFTDRNIKEQLLISTRQ